MADVDIKYNNQTIASMNSSGTKTLTTEGKYCTDDITVEYTKPQGEGGGSTPALIEKTISAGGTYNASDENADGYSKVIVPSGTRGALSAVKGTVNTSNKSVTVTSHEADGTDGFTSAASRNGSSVTVYASELCSGKAPKITANNNNINIAGYQSVDVEVTPTSSGRIGSRVRLYFSSTRIVYANVETDGLIGLYAYDTDDINVASKYSDGDRIVTSIFASANNKLITCVICDSDGWPDSATTISAGSNLTYTAEDGTVEMHINSVDYAMSQTHTWYLIPIYAG